MTPRQLFAVTRARGPAFDSSLPLEKQTDWASHRAFMNALVEDGFVVLGGPLEGTTDVLLIVRAEAPDEIVSRLEQDPWTRLNLLRTTQVVRWNLRLGSLAP